MPPRPTALAFVTVPVTWPATASVALMPGVVAPAVTATGLAKSIVGLLL